jgi:hypothetical protein
VAIPLSLRLAAKKQRRTINQLPSIDLTADDSDGDGDGDGGKETQDKIVAVAATPAWDNFVAYLA